jgi:hypothetical protein
MVTSRRVVEAVLILMLGLVASFVFAVGQPEDPAEDECDCRTVVYESPKRGEILEPDIVVVPHEDSIRVRFFESTREEPFGKPIDTAELVFAFSKDEFDRGVAVEGIRGLANIDLFVVVDGRSPDGRRVSIERSIQSIDSDKSKATIRFTPEFLAERVSLELRDLQGSGAQRLYFEMVPGVLLSHSAAVELEYLGPLEFAEDRSSVAFEVYVWPTDDLMVYIGG